MVLIRTSSLRPPARPPTHSTQTAQRASLAFVIDGPSSKTAINGTPWRISSAPSSAGGSTGSIWSLRDLRRRTLTDRACAR